MLNQNSEDFSHSLCILIIENIQLPGWKNFQGKPVETYKKYMGNMR
jgi:hypothetical protein